MFDCRICANRVPCGSIEGSWRNKACSSCRLQKHLETDIEIARCGCSITVVRIADRLAQEALLRGAHRQRPHRYTSPQRAACGRLTFSLNSPSIFANARCKFDVDQTRGFAYIRTQPAWERHSIDDETLALTLWTLVDEGYQREGASMVWCRPDRAPSPKARIPKSCGSPSCAS